MDDYWVLVEAHRDGGQPVTDPEGLTAAMMGKVEAFHGLCSVSENRWAARVSVSAVDAVEAGAVAAALIRSLAEKSALPAWPIVHLDATRGDLLGENGSRD